MAGSIRGAGEVCRRFMLLIALLGFLVAAGWSVVLASRPIDWRFRLLTGLLAAVALGHFVAPLPGVTSWGAVTRFELTGLPELALGVTVLLTVLLLDRVISRHGRVVQAYDAERAYLTELFENTPEAVALIDGDGRVLRINRPFTRLFGFGSDDVVGARIDDLLAPEDRVNEAFGLTHRVARGDRVNVESVRRRKDGTVVEVQIIGAPVKTPTGQVAVFSIYRDITERKRAEQSLRQLEKALETTQLGVTVTDLRGRIIYSNPADAAMHGYQVTELIGEDVSRFAPGGTRKPMSPEQFEAMGSWRRETQNARKDGSVFPVQLMSDVVRDASGSIVAVVTTCEDITQRKQAERQVRESEERYALAARGANDGLWDWNIESEEVYYSDRWKEILGHRGDEIGPHIETWLERVHPDDAERTRGELEDHIEGRTDHYENEHRVRHRDGTYRWVLVRGIAVRLGDGKPHRMAGSLTDITPRKNVEEQLAKDALYDPLTSLPNRAFFTNLLERSTRRTRRRKGYRFAVLFLDLDRFKVVNDTLGHEMGDELLIGVGERLEKCLRPGDVVARLAGDEFCILLEDIRDNSDATRVAERILEAMKAPFVLGGNRIFTNVSIGIATSESAAVGPEHLLRDADTAMYRAKSRGKGRFEVFDKAMHERAMAVLGLETDLRQALAEGQFRLMYMPVVSLDDGHITGFEALVRWEHPKRGLVPPSEFVPVAEETGLIVQLGRWVLWEACRQMTTWAERFEDHSDLSVSVNLSAKQLQQVDLVENVAEALRESGLDPKRLKLEIPEVVLMDDPEYSKQLVGQLNALGVEVFIDDFGTGYSSLAYLSHFNIDTLKIDRSLISNIGDRGSRAAVVNATIGLARDLGINVIAEGVETPEQLENLQNLRCGHGQGFRFSQPVDSKQAEELLKNDRTA